MDCYMGSGSSAVFQPKLGISLPSIEFYVVGCCSVVPVIWKNTIQVSPGDEEIENEQNTGNGLIRQQKLQITEVDVELHGKIGHIYYSEDLYPSEGGQLSWFNAGVRVGVGIGLGS